MARDRIYFALALVVYAVFSSPTPDVAGWPEFIILLFLILGLRIRLPDIKAPVTLFMAYGFSIPVFIALVHGYSPVEMMRDIIPFLFLLMPVLYAYERKEDTGFVAGLTCLIGVAFSFRTLMSFGEIILNPSQWLGPPPDLLYLANSPEVLFSCIVLVGLALNGKYKAGSSVCMFIFACLPLLAMALLMQRASLCYLALLGIYAWGVMWRYNTSRAVVLLFGAVAVFVTGYSVFGEIIHQLVFKTRMVGLNSRFEEWRAVYNQISPSATSFLFGLGWGAGFENPAVGGLRVHFTHSLISSLFLKTGLVGVIMFLGYGIGLLRRALPRLFQDRIYLCALAGPLIIGLGFYASYKSLGYGLLLLMLASLGNGKKLEISRPPVQ